MAVKKSLEGNRLLSLKVQEGKAIIGFKRVLKRLKEGRLGQVFLASNCPADLRQDIENYARMGEVPVVQLALNNEELGVLCKKNYFISVAGVMVE